MSEKPPYFSMADPSDDNRDAHRRQILGQLAGFDS
jgi:hypothetical protein